MRFMNGVWSPKWIGLAAILLVCGSSGSVEATTFTNWSSSAQGQGAPISSFGTQGFTTLGSDMDGDGVSNDQDECNDTPAGAPVNNEGCPVDSDADGVPDYLDRCPNTPFGMPVNYMGCPSDGDGDGVPDNVDRCPGTPTGFPVDQQGCITDSDRDGVPDHVDRCPSTPWGQRVGANGCGMDGDADGVHDFIDRCPRTAPGQRVGLNGCPPDKDNDAIHDGMDQCPGTPLGAQVDFRGCWVLNNVLFDSGKSKLKPASFPTLENVVVILRSNPPLRLEVQGHTDDKGKPELNRRLSEKRANAVRDYLVTQGVGPDRLTAVGFGMTHPITGNETSEGRAANRRVELQPL